MRLVLYNIRYATGSGWRFHLPFPFSGYLKHTKNNLAEITEFLKSSKPDIIGLIEVDSGSYRCKNHNQAAQIASEMNFGHVYQSKYKVSSLAQRLPILKSQGNALLTAQNIEDKGFHYFEKGIKRLVIELEFDSFVIFLVHLSVKFRHRQHQLNDLYTLFKQVKKPIIVAGDFNAFWGDRELALFQAASGLLNANTENIPTYPSNSPKRQLDFILHSPQIKISNFHIPQVKFSDHMPVICDFDVMYN